MVLGGLGTQAGGDTLSRTTGGCARDVLAGEAR